MANIRIVPATDADAVAMAPRLRIADLEELWAWAHIGPLDGLLYSLRASPIAWTGFVDDEPACMFGVGAASMLSAEGSPWMLGTDAVERHAYAFLRRNRAYVDRMRRVFPVLANYVDARHLVSLRWLRWLGFEIGPAVPYGVAGLPFHPFGMGG